jgi:hypothetical protein
MNSIDQYNPIVLKEGLYEASFHLRNEPLFVRMEKITEESAAHWRKYLQYCFQITNGSRGSLTVLTRRAGRDLKYSQYTEELGQLTGFSKEEFDAFLQKLQALKEKTHGKIADQLGSIPTGAMCLCTNPGQYVVYVTKNSAFSIEKACTPDTNLTYKKFREVYNDILITVGSSLGKKSLHNRGISRNPFWVLEEKYAGLSMLLHGFSSKVAESYFPNIVAFKVRPIGSMQAILTTHLQKGDGFVKADHRNIDITELPVMPDGPELYTNKIKVSALTRIYSETILKLSQA